MTILDNHTPSTHAAVATIGFFDGVHTGHRHLIEQVKSEARRRGLWSLLVTFADHPMRVIMPDFEPKLLTTADEKLRLLAGTGVDAIAVLDFTKEQSMMSAADFMEHVLHNIYNVRALLIGHDHHFGHDRTEGFDDYVRHGRRIGIDVLPASPLALPTGTVPSSTCIRQAVMRGDADGALTLLGYPYQLEGTVVAGFRNGHKLGYPTANLQVSPDKLMPAAGAYFVSVDIGGTRRHGMLNIGTRPTLDNGDEQSVEVHVFDFQGELYSQPLTVRLLHFIRSERRFDSLDALRRQLCDDEAACRRLMPPRKA